MLGDNIKKYRKENNISQEALGEKLGVSRQSISLWENNQTQPSLENIAALAKIFNVTTDCLLATSEVVKEPDIIKLNPAEKKPIVRKAIALTVVVTIFLVIILGAFFALKPLFGKPFSEDSNAIAIAETSVVKVVCYDHDGNESGTGSGFILFNEQTVITNYHVMEVAYTCKILTNTEVSYNVDGIIAYSEENDIAILSLEKATGLQPLKIGKSVDVKKGENIIAIGSPLGIENVISQGVISGRITEENIDSILFTAPISHGSSGGALFNNNGEVIGITYGSYESGQNLNLAIPIETAEQLYSKKATKINIDTIYKEANPYLEYLFQYAEATSVTFEELRNNPIRYRNKTVKITAYLSSFLGKNQFYFTDQTQYISSDWRQDSHNNLTFVNNGIPFGNYSILFVRGELHSEFQYSDEDFECGDIVTAIGRFEFTGDGELDEVFGEPFIRDGDTARVDAFVIYKER